MRRRGDELLLATTNGAPAIVAAARHAPIVLVGCLLNLDAVIAALEGADVLEALRVAGLAADIADCPQESTLEVLGRVRGTAPGIASVVDANATVDRCRAPSFSA